MNKNKRHRTDLVDEAEHDAKNEAANEEVDEEIEEASEDDSEEAEEETEHQDQDTNVEEASVTVSTDSEKSKKQIVKRMTQEQLEESAASLSFSLQFQEYQTSQDRRGVLYISRIPPGMNPGKLRRLLSEFGEVTRIFVQPEDSALTKKRRKRGGNRGKRFVEGWAEMADKKTAKTMAAVLNNSPIGGKRRSFFSEDLWNVKYLKGFKWHNLTDKIAFEKSVRETKIREEITQAKREAKFYLSKVDQAKAIQAMESRKSTKAAPVDPIRRFKQRSSSRARALAPAPASLADSVVKDAAAIGEQILRKVQRLIARGWLWWQ